MIATELVPLPRSPPPRPFAYAKAHRVLGPSRWTTAPVRVWTDPVHETEVDIDVDFSTPKGRVAPSRRGMERPRRIILRLAEGTTSIPKLAREFGITKSAVYPIAERAVRDGFLDRLPGIWPNTYRPGPNLLLTTASLTQMAPMRHRALSLEIGPSRTFRLRAHALQASVPVLALDGADLSAWTACKPNPVGRMHKVSTGGLRMQLRGRTLLVVSVPALTLAATEDTIQEAARRIKEHVSKYVILARKTAREKYHIQAGSPARWYRKPHVAIERFPGVPEGVAYTVSFWVDSSLGPAEVESANLETIESLMAVGNRISRDLSMSTFA